MVEVDQIPLRPRQVLQVPIVGIVRQEGDVLRANAFKDAIGDRRLAGAGAAGDSDHYGGRWGGHRGDYTSGQVLPLSAGRGPIGSPRQSDLLLQTAISDHHTEPTGTEAGHVAGPDSYASTGSGTDGVGYPVTAAAGQFALMPSRSSGMIQKAVRY